MKKLYLIKRSSGRVETDMEVSRVEVVGGLEVAIPGKHTIFMDILSLDFVSFGQWTHYTYRTTKKDGTPLKKAVKELVNPNGLWIDTEYTEKVFDGYRKLDMCFRCLQIEEKVRDLNGNYTKADLLDVVNTISTETYKSVVFVEDEVKAIVDRIGGYREKEILKDCYFSIVMWTDEHKCVKCTSIKADDDGYRKTCEIDLVSGLIVG